MNGNCLDKLSLKSRTALFYARKGLGKGLKASAFRKFCRSNKGLQVTEITAHGFSMNLIIGDSVDNRIFINGTFEPETTAIIEELSAQADGFIDVGCNIGYYSCLFAANNKQAKIIMVDANPAIIDRAIDNMSLNKISNFEAFAVAIGEKEDELELHIPENRHSLSSLAFSPTSGGKVQSVKVPVKPLGRLQGIERFKNAILKIDAEGYEPKIFSGISEQCAQSIKYIVFEWASDNLKNAGLDPNAVFAPEWTKRFIYKLLDHPDIETMEHAEAAEYIPSRIKASNILMTRKDIA